MLSAICAICDTNNVKLFNLIDVNLLDDFPGDLEAYNFAKKYYSKYGVLPNIKVLSNEIAFAGYDNTLPVDYIYEEDIKNRKYVISQNIVNNINDGLRSGRLPSQKELDKLNKLVSGPAINYETGEELELDDFDRKKSLDFKINNMDNETGGIGNGELATIVGISGSGKTMLLIYLSYLLLVDNKNIGFISYEMSNKQIKARLYGFLGKFNPRYLRLKERPQGALAKGVDYRPDNLGDRFDNAKEILVKQQNKVFFPTIKPDTVYDVPNFVNSLPVKLDVLLIDGMHLIGDGNRNKANWETMTNVSSSLKMFAGELDIPIIAVSQANRASAKKRIKDLDASNVGFSLSVFQDSDFVIATANGENVLEYGFGLIKNRYGQSGIVNQISFDYDTMNATVLEIVNDD